MFGRRGASAASAIEGVPIDATTPAMPNAINSGLSLPGFIALPGNGYCSTLFIANSILYPCIRIPPRFHALSRLRISN